MSVSIYSPDKDALLPAQVTYVTLGPKKGILIKFELGLFIMVKKNCVKISK